MIACLTGKLLYSDPVAMNCVIDCAGVGYCVTVTTNTFAKLPAADEDSPSVIRLFTHMQISSQTTASEITLYGFLEKDELALFRLLITVQGVGPKAAMAILSLYDTETLASIIANEDTRSIAKASGVGSKTAARVVLELSEKVQKIFPVLVSPTGEKKTAKMPARAKNSPAVADARDALIVLGYSQAAVNAALAECDPTLPTEALIRSALAVLSSN